MRFLGASWGPWFGQVSVELEVMEKRNFAVLRASWPPWAGQVPDELEILEDRNFVVRLSSHQHFCGALAFAKVQLGAIVCCLGGVPQVW